MTSICYSCFSYAPIRGHLICSSWTIWLRQLKFTATNCLLHNQMATVQQHLYYRRYVLAFTHGRPRWPRKRTHTRTRTHEPTHALTARAREPANSHGQPEPAAGTWVVRLPARRWVF